MNSFFPCLLWFYATFTETVSLLRSKPELAKSLLWRYYFCRVRCCLQIFPAIANSNRAAVYQNNRYTFLDWLCFESILVRPGIRNFSARFNRHRIHTPNFKPVKFQIQKCIYSEARCLALVVSCSNIAFFKECAQLLVAKRTFLNPLCQGLSACIL